MPSIECSNEECGIEFYFELGQLDIETSHETENHTTSYTYTGEIKCPECGCGKYVEYITNESDETGDIFTIEKF